MTTPTCPHCHEAAKERDALVATIRIYEAQDALKWRTELIAERNQALGEISRMTMLPAQDVIDAERKRAARLDEMQADRDHLRAVIGRLGPLLDRLPSVVDDTANYDTDDAFDEVRKMLDAWSELRESVMT